MRTSKEEILHLMTEYCYRVDSGNWDAFSDLFKHGSWEVTGDPAGEYKGKEGLLRLTENVTLHEGIPHTKHAMSNVEITVDESDDSATSRSYITVFQALPPHFPLQPIFIGSYENQFKKIDGVWYLTSMRISPDLIGDLRFHRADMTEA